MKWLQPILDWIKNLLENKVGKPVLPPTVQAPALLVPWAVIPERKMLTKMQYTANYPQGAVIHFTAGRDRTEQDALDSYYWGCDNSYVYFIIGPTGKLYQGFSLSHGGPHAGLSEWPNLGKNVSTKLVGIEIACAGKLDKWGRSWFRQQYAVEEIRNGFKKFTPEQEEALIKLLVWLKKNNPEVFNIDYILGHEEVSPGRKPDPGYSLSMSMGELRDKIKSFC